MKKERDTKCILIAAAVNEELEFLNNNLLNSKTSAINHLTLTTGLINTTTIILAATGPGVVNTAHALTSVIKETQPSLIIQTGCAGAFDGSGLSIGDVGIATCDIDVHSGIESESGDNALPTALPFPVASKNNRELTNRFPTDKQMSDHAFSLLSKKKNRGYKLVKGPFITVSTITATDKRMELLYDAFTPCMESMEGSAAAHVAFLYDIPFIEIRSASNRVGKRDKKRWNLPLAFKNCNLAVLDLINTLAGTI